MIVETILSALVGLLGTGLTTYSNYKMEKLKADTELAKLKAETELMIAEANASIRLTETAGEMKVQETEANAFLQSQKSLKPALPSAWISILFNQNVPASLLTVPVGLLLTILLGIGDAIANVMRSVLTLYCLAITSWVTYKSYEIVERFGSFTSLEAYECWTEASTLAYLLSVTMITWWFGDRRVAQHLMHQKGKK